VNPAPRSSVLHDAGTAGRVSSQGVNLAIQSSIPDCSYPFDFHAAKLRILFDISKFFGKNFDKKKHKK
jgi:hypothetical protein